eukprot:TRINITY_DN644_c2_g1_i1.p2 TRINITY_DN644_c2_g1~~TRINITY_DN644_c2_g1_i1.p2  ORF type:complete len:360 (+),score=81.87 TRINITY_DN644_c2_g1_i1:100-1080(+)
MADNSVQWQSVADTGNTHSDSGHQPLTGFASPPPVDTADAPCGRDSPPPRDADGPTAVAVDLLGDNGITNNILHVAYNLMLQLPVDRSIVAGCTAAGVVVWALRSCRPRYTRGCQPKRPVVPLPQPGSQCIVTYSSGLAVRAGGAGGPRGGVLRTIPRGAAVRLAQSRPFKGRRMLWVRLSEPLEGWVALRDAKGCITLTLADSEPATAHEVGSAHPGSALGEGDNSTIGSFVDLGNEQELMMGVLYSPATPAKPAPSPCFSPVERGPVQQDQRRLRRLLPAAADGSRSAAAAESDGRGSLAIGSSTSLLEREFPENAAVEPPAQG